MKKRACVGAAWLLGVGWAVGCSEGTQGTGKDQAGTTESTGAGGSNSSAGSAGDDAGSAGETEGGMSGGDAGQGGNAVVGDGSPGGGSVEQEAGRDASPADGGDYAGASGSDGSAPSPPGWYEAEAIPPNEKAEKSTISHGVACQSVPPKPGDMCESGGGEVNWITSARNGWLQYNQVSAPSDGMYDVTWWYHCGKSDNYGDVHCGGQTNPPTTPSGCRPHQIVVNGVEMPGTYHLPCYPGPWVEIHAATTVLPLKAGSANVIKVYPKERDSADMDALQVQAAGQGIGPVITSNGTPGSN